SHRWVMVSAKIVTAPTCPLVDTGMLITRVPGLRSSDRVSRYADIASLSCPRVAASCCDSFHPHQPSPPASSTNPAARASGQRGLAPAAPARANTRDLSPGGGVLGRADIPVQSVIL